MQALANKAPAADWSPRNWIMAFCALGGLVLPQARVIQWSEAVTDFESMPTDMATLAQMSRVMIELDAAPNRRAQVFAYLGG